VADSTPSSSAIAHAPSAHASSEPRWPRTAWAAGDDSPAMLGGALSRAANTPAPMSRRWAIRHAATRSSAVRSAIGTSRTGCAPTNGRSSSAQPNGVTQRSHSSVSDVSATIRRSSPTTSAMPPIPSAPRRVGASWLVNAPIPAYTTAGETSASARYAAPPTSTCAGSAPRKTTSHSATAPTPTAAIAAPNAVRRATTPASTSSRRPDSSSARSARTAPNSPHSAAKTGRKPSRHDSQPPVVSRSCGVP
jgi:hypothetical protein